MTDTIEQRDFFISFNSADLAYAEAIDVALKSAGFTTYFHPIDLAPGGNIPLWMDNALMNSRQMLALCSPDYMAEGAVYSEAERYAQFWRDSRGAKSKLIFVELRQTTFTPLMSLYKRIDAKGKNRTQAAAAVITALKRPEETEQRKVIQSVEPLPKIFNVLYRHNPNFTGRFEAMELLQKSLNEGNAAITAVSGMGGVGKTTLAAEYCHRFGGRYGGVWWVRAEQEPVMLTDLTALGQRLGLTATGNVETDARAALEDLASRNDPWLMVYDNAPNADVISKWLPTGSVRCLITSRFTSFDGIARVTPLDQWSDEVTADYLLARTRRDDRAAALRLAHALAGLPLAAEQAALFLKDRKGISFDDYAREIARLIKEEKLAGAKGNYPDTVYAAFVKSIETIGGTKDGNTALNLVRLCAFLSPDAVDLDLLLIDDGDEILPAEFTAAMSDRFAREDILAALASLSLLRQEESSAGTVLIFHRLLLEVMRDWMGSDARELWGKAAVHLVNNLFPVHADTYPSKWPLCARLMPHVALLDAHTPRTSDTNERLAALLNNVVGYLIARGDHTGALAMAEKTVTLLRQTETDNLRNLASALSNLAGRYDNLDRLDEAEKAYGESLAIKEGPLFNPKDPSLAITLTNLAEIHRKRKDFGRAETLNHRAAEIIEAVYGPKSAEYGSVLSNLGVVYGTWKKEPGQAARHTREAECLTQSLYVTRAACGARNPQTAIRYNNLAVMKAERDDWTGAAADSEFSVAIMLSLDLPEHPDTRRRMVDLAVMWQRSGLPSKAARLRGGDLSDLLPVIAQIEAEQRAWVAEDPKNRHFGPLSPFTSKK